jgi:hypothetical protein
VKTAGVIDHLWNGRYFNQGSFNQRPDWDRSDEEGGYDQAFVQSDYGNDDEVEEQNMNDDLIKMIEGDWNSP